MCRERMAAPFDADKLDVTGAIGMARTFFYAAQVGQPTCSPSWAESPMQARI